MPFYNSKGQKNVDIVTQDKDAAQSIVSQKKEEIEIVTPFTLLFAIRSCRHLSLPTITTRHLLFLLVVTVRRVRSSLYERLANCDARRKR